MNKSVKYLNYEDDHIESMETGCTKVDLNIDILDGIINFEVNIDVGYTSNANWGEISYKLCGYNTMDRENNKKIINKIKNLLLDNNLTEINEDSVIHMITELINEAVDEMDESYIIENMDDNTFHFLGL